MTPGELLSRAARLRAQAAGMDADALRLRGQAGALRGLLDPLVTMSQQVWVGPAARDFESQVRAHGGVVDEQAGRIERVADQLIRKARDARIEAQRLDAQAAASSVITTATLPVIPSTVR